MSADPIYYELVAAVGIDHPRVDAYVAQRREEARVVEATARHLGVHDDPKFKAAVATCDLSAMREALKTLAAKPPQRPAPPPRPSPTPTPAVLSFEEAKALHYSSVVACMTYMAAPVEPAPAAPVDPFVAIARAEARRG